MKYCYHIRVVPVGSSEDAKGRWLTATTKTPVNWRGTMPQACEHFKRHVPKGHKLVQFADARAGQ